MQSMPALGPVHRGLSGHGPEELYAAFLDPAALIDWLPPAEMTGEIHEFDARVAGWVLDVAVLPAR
jgi:uncharacterized protein YndB with AHSA1/START domain